MHVCMCAWGEGLTKGGGGGGGSLQSFYGIQGTGDPYYLKVFSNLCFASVTQIIYTSSSTSPAHYIVPIKKKKRGRIQITSRTLSDVFSRCGQIIHRDG